MAKDLICGANIDEQKAVETYFQRNTYYFCSSACRGKSAGATLAGINP